MIVLKGQVPLLEEEFLNILEHLSSPPFFSRVHAVNL
jgi:hypothetical protein